jgi:hypothetical protein
MNERERWIVYPLLFLALGAGLRDKLFDQTRTKSIECQDLTVAAEDGGGRPPILLTRIRAADTSPIDKTPTAQMLLNGQLFVGSIRASAIYADKVYADNYVYHGIPFAPTILRALPSMVRPPANGPPADKPADTAPDGSSK